MKNREVRPEDQSTLVKFRKQAFVLVKEQLAIELQLLNCSNAITGELLSCYTQYLDRHGDLNARDQRTGEILHDSNGLPIPIKVPRADRARVELLIKLNDFLKVLYEHGLDEKENRPLTTEEIKVIAKEYFKPCGSN